MSNTLNGNFKRLAETLAISNNVVLLVAVCFSSQETIFNRASVYENRCVMIKKKNVFGRAYVNLTGFQAPKV